MAQPGLNSTATAVSTKAKVKGRNKKRKKSTMAGGVCTTISIFEKYLAPFSLLMRVEMRGSG